MEEMRGKNLNSHEIYDTEALCQTLEYGALYNFHRGAFLQHLEPLGGPHKATFDDVLKAHGHEDLYENERRKENLRGYYYQVKAMAAVDYAALLESLGVGTSLATMLRFVPEQWEKEGKKSRKLDAKEMEELNMQLERNGEE